MSEEISQPASNENSEAVATSDATVVNDSGEAVNETIYANKYKSVTELEKGYTELQKRFGAFESAPEAYTIAEGIEHNAEHPILEQIQTFGKENNLSNEGYNNLVNVLLDNERSNIEAQEAQAEQVMKDLGANANERVQNIDDFLGANLQLDDSMKGLIDTAKQTPGGVELLEAFIGMSKKTSPASEQVAAPVKTYSRDELNKLQFATDDYGNRKMASDPQYRKMVDEYTAKLIAQG